MALQIRDFGASIMGAGAATALALGLLGAQGATAAPARVSVGYFGNYDVYSGFYPKNIAAADYTHINYAFANPTASKTCALTDPSADYIQPISAANAVNGHADGANQKLRGNFNQFEELKAAHPGLKVLISVGGATLSSHFSDIALTATSRQKFVSSCINLFLKGNLPVSGTAGGAGAAKGVFDGIDIDWEFPVTGPGGRPADRHNATLLFKEFRRQLDAYGNTVGKHFLLTAAIPPGNEANDRYEIANVSQSLDWMNLMVYDLHGSWDMANGTDFDSPFKYDSHDPNGSTQFTVKGTAKILVAAGVPRSKIVLGVPFYAYEYSGVSGDNTNKGLYQPATAVTSNTTYRALVNGRHLVTASANPTGQNGYTRSVSAAAASRGSGIRPRPAAPSSRTRTRSRSPTGQLREGEGLRGLMAWEVSQDEGPAWMQSSKWLSAVRSPGTPSWKRYATSRSAARRSIRFDHRPPRSRWRPR